MKLFKNKLPKMILVHYINVENLTHEATEKYMDTVQSAMSLKNKNIIEYFIPVIDRETKTECIYSKK